jgi:hypothetical protein
MLLMKNATTMYVNVELEIVAQEIPRVTTVMPPTMSASVRKISARVRKGKYAQMELAVITFL